MFIHMFIVNVQSCLVHNACYFWIRCSLSNHVFCQPCRHFRVDIFSVISMIFFTRTFDPAWVNNTILPLCINRLLKCYNPAVVIFSLGSFRLQSTCRYQRSREDVCPQHKATGHVSKYVNSRCAIENCLMSARNIRATAHAPCSQHTFNRNLELKTDQFHGVYRLVTPST